MREEKFCESVGVYWVKVVWVLENSVLQRVVGLHQGNERCDELDVTRVMIRSSEVEEFGYAKFGRRTVL